MLLRTETKNPGDRRADECKVIPFIRGDQCTECARVKRHTPCGVRSAWHLIAPTLKWIRLRSYRCESAFFCPFLMRIRWDSNRKAGIQSAEICSFRDWDVQGIPPPADGMRMIDICIKRQGVCIYSNTSNLFSPGTEKPDERNY